MFIYRIAFVYILIVFYFVFVFCICFIGDWAKFKKYAFILALYILICLLKFEIMQCILKYKCIFICILSYYTYSGTEYSDGPSVNYT